MDKSSMKRVVIQVPVKTAADLNVLVERCTQANQRREGCTSQGDLTVAGFLSMLAEDAGMVISRPGSWEGSNMAQVLQSHGYEV